jgi:hypothetical protein
MSTVLRLAKRQQEIPMKSPILGSRLIALMVSLMTMALMVPTASAYTIHQLGPQHFAIVCEDETTFSIHSNLDGAVTNAQIFCQGHGGVAGGNAGGMNVVRASSKLARGIEDCQRSGGQKVQRNVTRCPRSASISKRSARTGRVSE